MSSVLGKWMTIVIAITVMFTPLLAYLDSLHRNAVDTVLLEASKKAAIEGRYTQAIKEDMRKQLVENYNFERDAIEIDADSTLKQRNEYIEASITVPRGPIFILDLFNQGPDRIQRSVRVLSEYVGSL